MSEFVAQGFEASEASQNVLANLSIEDRKALKYSANVSDLSDKRSAVEAGFRQARERAEELVAGTRDPLSD